MKFINFGSLGSFQSYKIKDTLVPKILPHIPLVKQEQGTYKTCLFQLSPRYPVTLGFVVKKLMLDLSFSSKASQQLINYNINKLFSTGE